MKSAAVLLTATAVTAAWAGCLRSDEDALRRSDAFTSGGGFRNDPSSGIEFEVIDEGVHSEITDRRTLVMRSQDDW